MLTEQCRGETLDGRSDVFACGTVLYQLIVGRLPFPGHDDAQVMEDIARRKVIPPAAAGAELGEEAAAFEAPDPTLPIDMRSEETSLPCRRGRGGIAAALAILVVGVALALVSSQKEPPAHGTLTVDTVPWAEVYLDDKRLGLTPIAGLEVPAGRHTLTFVNRERRLSKKVAVEGKPGGAVRLRLRLAE